MSNWHPYQPPPLLITQPLVPGFLPRRQETITLTPATPSDYFILSTLESKAWSTDPLQILSGGPLQHSTSSLLSRKDWLVAEYGNNKRKDRWIKKAVSDRELSRGVGHDGEFRIYGAAKDPEKQREKSEVNDTDIVEKDPGILTLKGPDNARYKNENYKEEIDKD
ncbi:hypothetical protein BDZ45DRAFT_736252 [Acephala macrosclerotiorum]|nr:hypothetical protein BDZ45DRAFT_736252 [Acephala macrosclerotiorum]